MKILCALGIHQWQATQEAVYFSEQARRLAIPDVEAERACTRPGCTARQVRDEHCLGFHPPTYVYRWVTK